VKLPIVRKTFGIIEGAHPSIFKGIGQDFAEFGQYQPGDNIKNIDWKATAKTGALVLKQFQADSNTNLSFILDSGREMVTRSSSGERKIDVVRTVCNTFGYLSSMRYDAVGVLAGDQDKIMVERAKLSFVEVSDMLNKVEKISTVNAPNRSFSKVLVYANEHFNKRTFIVLVFDETTAFHVQAQFINLIRKLKARHDVFAVSIQTLNPFKPELPKSNGLIIDIKNRQHLPAFFRTTQIESTTKKNIQMNRKKLAFELQRAGVPHISTSGSKDFFKKLTRIMTRREVAKL
jgi:uncharacterized protein (DUF58 family)